MILALGILIVMLLFIMLDVMPFGAPPLFASVLIVIAGTLFGADWEVQWDIPYAFSGFTNATVWMVAFFMVVLAALQKTRLIGRIKGVMRSLVERGGFKSYVLLVLVVMAGAILMGNTTGYYVLVLSLVTTIPYSKKLPTSKLLMPLGFATGNPIVAVNVAFYYALAVSVLEAAGFTGEIDMTGFMVMSTIASLGFLAWCVIGYRVLPDHEVEGAAEDQVATSDVKNSEIPVWQEYLTVVAFIVSVVAMMMLNSLGNIGYIAPGICAFVLLLAKVVNFKEMREGIFSPLILMMAGVIPVANALADSGLTALIGSSVAGVIGAGAPPFAIVLVFAVLTSVCASFTGSNIGSAFIFAPVAIATCMSLGLNPSAVAAAVVASAWCGGFMPVDGLPAMILGMGKYSMQEFWAFSVPMYIVKIVALSAGAVIAFPM